MPAPTGDLRGPRSSIERPGRARYALVAAAIAALAGGALYAARGGRSPVASPAPSSGAAAPSAGPLLTLDRASLPELERAFDEASDRTRVLAMLSPT